jgi:cytochrome P450
MENIVSARRISVSAFHIFLIILQVGRGLIAADGESHRRQWKVIAPGFSTVKIREYTSTFLECAHKVRYLFQR